MLKESITISSLWPLATASPGTPSSFKKASKAAWAGKTVHKKHAARSGMYFFMVLNRRALHPRFARLPAEREFFNQRKAKA